MNRRNFVGYLAAGVLVRLPGTALPRVEAATIKDHLEALSVFGRPDGGTFQDGVSRIGYSDADIAGRKFVMDLMRSAGAEVRIDAAGNIFASRRGADASLPSVLFGSHIDSVPNGGNFDGDLGSLSAIQILRMLNDLPHCHAASAHGRRLGMRRGILCRGDAQREPCCSGETKAG